MVRSLTTSHHPNIFVNHLLCSCSHNVCAQRSNFEPEVSYAAQTRPTTVKLSRLSSSRHLLSLTWIRSLFGQRQAALHRGALSRLLITMFSVPHATYMGMTFATCISQSLHWCVCTTFNQTVKWIRLGLAAVSTNRGNKKDIELLIAVY